MVSTRIWIHKQGNSIDWYKLHRLLTLITF